MGRRVAGLAVVGWTLACGGMPASEIEAQLQGTCRSPAVAEHGELVLLERDLPTPRIAVQLSIVGDTWNLDGDVLDPDAGVLQARLTQKAETAKDLARRASGEDFAFRGELLVAAAPETPAAVLVDVLEAAYASEFVKARFVVRTGLATPPAFADPAYSAELGGKLAGASPEMRAVTLAQEMEGLLVACPPGQEVFAAVAHASVEFRCQLMSQGMAEALPMCPLTDHGRVVTAMQVAARMGQEWDHGVLDLKLAPQAPPFVVAPDAPWSEVALRWADEAETTRWWTLSEG